MESSPSAAVLQNARGTSISGNAQVITDGRDVVVQHGLSPTGLPGIFRPVSNATHTRSGPVARCDVGTRLQVIATIEQWLDGPDKEPAVCWSNGPAGYGKSALSQTIAERYAAEGRLLGSFFFLRGAGEQSHISRLIPTLAHQISLSIPATKPLLEKALRDEPAILEPSVAMAHQFQRLIIGPIHSTTSGSFSAFQIFSRLTKRWILIIDALE